MNRSCKYCLHRYVQQSFIDKVHMCNLTKEQTTLEGYCDKFKEIKK